MPHVYVVNHGPHDYTDAERFGDLVFCTEGSLDRFDVSQMARELELELADSEPCDFILLTSLTSLCSVACAIFAAKHGCLNLLIYKAPEGYLSRSLTFNQTTRSNNGNRKGSNS